MFCGTMPEARAASDAISLLSRLLAGAKKKTPSARRAATRGEGCGKALRNEDQTRIPRCIRQAKVAPAPAPARE